jgi:ATP-dependent DNA helicase RecG
MHRLLQGEVGSGKTVVAAYAAAVVLGDGQQVAFMVPTEILAQQHYRVLRAWFEPLGVRVFLLTAALPREDRQALLKVLSQGEGVLVVGTHALIQEEVVFAKLGLVIIDEQHKFGVSQRQELCNKADNPELLIMTATPIPRTLAMSLYADLDISTLHELPAGRSPVETMLVESQERERAYKFVEGKIKEGRQAYIIYPIIEGSSVFGVRAAGEMYRYLAKEVFPELRLGLTHGRLPVKKSQAVMESFRQGRLDIMVATTVLEVGVDVPNAAVMVIEGAERFGLSQLHQLRGRIGRGSYPSYCILIPTAQEAEAQERLEVIVRYRDGFRIAEEDLKIRGPGEFFGCRQHGLSELRISSPLSECQLLEEARQEAEGFLRNDPSLKTQPGRLIREGIERSFPACASWPAS